MIYITPSRTFAVDLNKVLIIKYDSHSRQVTLHFMDSAQSNFFLQNIDEVEWKGLLELFEWSRK